MWSCNLNLAGNSFHCRSRTANDLRCQLSTTFLDESKDFYEENSGPSSYQRTKQSWLSGVCRRRRFGLYENCVMWSSPDQKKTTNKIVKSFFRRRLRKPASCDIEIRFKVWSNMTTFEFWEGARQNVGASLTTRNWPKPETAHQKSLASRSAIPCEQGRLATI